MKVLIHFGFPKTGSSTLQFGLFKPLHKMGVINLNTWRRDNPDERLDRRPSSRLFMNLNILDESIAFENDKLNVLSDESFTAPKIIRRFQYGDRLKNPFEFPKAIKKQIAEKYGENVSYKCLMVVRNQPDLIYSQFVEEYELKRYRKISSIFYDSKKIDLEGYNIYNFHQYYKELEAVFGFENVHLLLFEQLRSDIVGFCKGIASAMSIESQVVIEYLRKSHVNKKEKNKKGYYTKNSMHLVPYFSEIQKSIIHDHFRQDNLNLQEELFGKYDLYELGYL